MVRGQPSARGEVGEVQRRPGAGRAPRYNREIPLDFLRGRRAKNTFPLYSRASRLARENSPSLTTHLVPAIDFPFRARCRSRNAPALQVMHAPIDAT